MALVKCQKQSSPNSPVEISDGETEDDEALNKSEKSECFFARKGTALVLALKDAVPHSSNERRLSTESLRSTNSTQSNNSDIHLHLQSMFNLLRNEETLKMAVKLESQRPNRTRYIVIASRCCFRTNNQTTNERKTKIMRHNSVRLSATSASVSTLGANFPPVRQLSVDSNSNKMQQQHQQQSQQQQPDLNAPTAAVESVTASQNNSTISSNTTVTITSSSPPSRQTIKCDGDRNTATIDIKCNEDEGTEESCLLGIDCNEHTTIGLVVPILADTTIRLDGDGGFSVSVFNKTHIFKPVSVQAMWSALQTLHKVSQKARENNFYPGGPSHDWLTYYESRIESEQSCLNEWNAMDSLESRRPPSPDAIRNKPTAKEETESVIKMKLKEIMMSVDLDEVTSKYIRGRLEEHLDMDLGEYKSFIDQEMLTILGQMDSPTEIFEHVYLGSEWNASNLEELQKNGVRHILNVTREIDNFFPGMFDYFNVRVYDDEKTNLLKHWDNTYRYITRAKAEGSKVLVHCKMGVSRSASVVIAYAMKAYNWEFQKALQHVKGRRNCIKPNKNFLNQLETYRGMLDAMKNKEKLQRSKSETNLKSTKDARLLPGSEPTPLIQALNQSKSKLATTHGSPDESTRISVCSSDTSMLTSENQRQRQRGVRRSSSTSPKGSSSNVAIVCKQQSQSLENLTPERSVADEPKNMRFPGSNGENYSVTQNRVLHIQKNTPPPPPPPPPPPLQVSQPATSQAQASSVRTIIYGLEGGSQDNQSRKTVDDRKLLNLPFGRSISQDTSTSAAKDTSDSVSKKSLGSPVWTTSTRLIPQSSNLDAISGTLRSSLRGRREPTANCSIFSHEHSQQYDNTRSRRKTQSWAATSGGIVMDSKLGSNSSIDSASSGTNSSCKSQCQGQGNVARATVYDIVRTRHRQRELPSRHASWGSGDNRYGIPMRNSSWNSYDSNRNATINAATVGNTAIFEGRIHELNTSNKTATHPAPTTTAQQHFQQQQQQQQSIGTVKRTKQKLEECTKLKKLCQENDGGNECGRNDQNTPQNAAPPKRNSNLYRSSSSATSSARTRYPLRCNSDEIISPSTQAGIYSPAALRRSDGGRPSDNSAFFAPSSAPEAYTISDIENKNLLPQVCSGINDDDDESSGVELRNTVLTTAEEQQRISGNVQILKKNFEAKAGAPASMVCNVGNFPTTSVNTSSTQNIGATKKGHQSLPSSPMAQHVGHQDVTVSPTIETELATTKSIATLPISTTITAVTSTGSTSSSCSSSSSVSECDRNVKGLVHKYQTTTTATAAGTAVAPTTTTNLASNTKTTVSSTASQVLQRPARPRSYYEPNRRTDKLLTGKPHEFSDSRPPPGPTKNQMPMTESNSQNQQQQPQLQHRRLQHGKTHPLARLSLPKQSFNTAAYNTIFFDMLRSVSCSFGNERLKNKSESRRSNSNRE